MVLLCWLRLLPTHSLFLPQHVPRSSPLHLTLLDRSPNLARDFGSAHVRTFNWFAGGPGNNLGKESTALQDGWLKHCVQDDSPQLGGLVLFSGKGASG